MNCAESEQFFDAYLDGELSGAMRLEFDAHRLRCTLCQQKLAMMEACEHILAGDSRAPSLSADFADRVMRDVNERRIIVLRRRRWVTIGSTLLANAAAITLLVAWWPSGSSPTPDNPMVAAAGHASTAELDDAIEGGFFGVYDYMTNLKDQFAAAGGTLARDYQNVREYAASWTVPVNVGEAIPTLIEHMLSGPTQPEPDPDVQPAAPNTTGDYSL